MNESLSDWPLYSSQGGHIDCRSGGLAYSNTGSFGGNLSFSASIASASAGFTGNIHKTSFRLADVNGDGLPDQIGKHAGEAFFRVRFNLGDCFSGTTVREWQIDTEKVLSEAVNHDLSLLGGQMEATSLPGTPLGIPGYEGFPSSGNNFEDAVQPLSVDDTLDYSSGVAFNLGASLTLSWDWWMMALVLTPGSERDLRYNLHLPAVPGLKRRRAA